MDANILRLCAQSVLYNSDRASGIPARCYTSPRRSGLQVKARMSQWYGQAGGLPPPPSAPRPSPTSPKGWCGSRTLAKKARRAPLPPTCRSTNRPVFCNLCGNAQHALFFCGVSWIREGGGCDGRVRWSEQAKNQTLLCETRIQKADTKRRGNFHKIRILAKSYSSSQAFHDLIS